MMNDRKSERAAKVISALLFVAAVTMFILTFVVQLDYLELEPEAESANIEVNIEEEAVQNASVSLSDAVESKNDISEDTDESVEVATLQTIVKPSERVKKTVEEPVIETIEEVVGVVEVVEEPVVDPEELELMAKVIYQEAGGDACSDEARRMVGEVVLNRVASEYFPDTLEEVLLQERQYGRYHWTGIIWPERASYESEAHAVERARQIATDLLTGKLERLLPEDVLFQAEFPQNVEIVAFIDGIYFCR